MSTNSEYEINDRIVILMDAVRYKPVDFAKAIDIIPSRLTNTLQKRNKPGLEIVKKILKNFTNVNPYWLLLGEGEMFLPESEEMDYEKMKQGFSLDIKPQAATGSVIPSGVYQDTRKDLEREQRLHESERARVDKLIDALTSRDTHSDKSLIDYSRVGVRRDCGVLLEDEPAEKKRAAG